MILSDAGIKHALAQGQLEIHPVPQENQYTTSAVDLFLGSIFQSWDDKVFKVPGTKIDLNLAEQTFSATAAASSSIFPSKKTAVLYYLPTMCLLAQFLR